MTDQPNTATPAADGATPAGPPQHRRRRGPGRAILIIAGVLLAAGLVGVVASNAFSHGPGFGPGFGRWHGHGMWGQMDPAQIEDRADRMVRHLAIEVDATAEQQDKLRAVVKSAVKDMLPMREKAQAARLRGRELLTQATVDRAAIEAFRTEQMALADAFSRRLTQALADAATVLTPEQRRKVSEMLPPRPFWRRWHRG
jgi:Spy/CpxP family protein refolding chaperone